MAAKRLGEVVVVGAGWAGLSAAWHLSEKGYEVTVLERTRRLGGRTFSFTNATTHDILDNGEHVLLGLCTHTLSLLGQAQLDSCVRLQPLLNMPIITPKVHSVLASWHLYGPLHLFPSLTRYPLLSPQERFFALKAGMAILQENPDLWDTVSFAKWLAQHQQSPRAIQYLWNAVGTEVLNARAESLSAAIALKTFQKFLRSGWSGARLGLFVQPLGEIVEALAQRLSERGVRFRLGETVQRIIVRQNQVTGVQTAHATYPASRVVVAVPPDRALYISQDSGLQDRLHWPELTFSPIVNVYLFYDQVVWDGEVAMLADNFGAVLFNRSRLFNGSDRTVLVVSISAADALRSLEPEEIARRIAQIVQERLGIAAPVSSRVVWQPHATFLAAPGTEQLRPAVTTTIKGLFVAGDWVDTGWPPCIESAVLSGQTVAQVIESGTRVVEHA